MAATLVASPSNTLGIKIQRVKTAYFAKKETKEGAKTGETHTYTFRGKNTTKTPNQKKGIAGIIYNNIKKQHPDKSTTIDQIVSVLTKSSYKRGDTVKVPLVKPKVEFTKLPNAANFGDEVYIVVKTEHMPGREIKMTLKQGGDSKVLNDVKKNIYVTQDDKEVEIFKAKVGEFAEKEDIANADDFKDYAIAKIKLSPKDDKKSKAYRDALEKAEDKKSLLYLVMDAEPADQNWFEVWYEEVFDNRPNIWYYGEGHWFEVKGGSVKIKYLFSSKKDDVSEKSKKILNEIGLKSKNDIIFVTSTIRSARKQAEIMYSQTVSKGVTAQKALYGSNGDKVIDVYVEEKANNKTKSEIISKMEEKINEIGASKVSKHCGDSSKMNVIDISSRRLKNPRDFLSELRKYEKNGKIKKVINETDRNCYHIEIIQ